MALTESDKRVIDLIDEKELVDLAVAMGNITAPSGYEQPMADFVLRWLSENGFERSFQQPICDGRSNTIGILNGQGGGRNLIFNSHMTRQPVMVGLDLKCEIAANNVAKSRMQALYEQFGPELVAAVSQEMLHYSEAILRKRIGEIPDGEWRDTGSIHEEVHQAR